MFLLSNFNKIHSKIIFLENSIKNRVIEFTFIELIEFLLNLLNIRINRYIYE